MIQQNCKNGFPQIALPKENGTDTKENNPLTKFPQKQNTGIIVLAKTSNRKINGNKRNGNKV